MNLTRREFLKKSAVIGTVATLSPQTLLAGFHYGTTAKDIYIALWNLKNAGRDIIDPKISRFENGLVFVERVMGIDDKRYTTTVGGYLQGDYDKLPKISKSDLGALILKPGLGLHQRTLGPNYNTSLIFVDDDNLDDKVDKGETRKTIRVVTPKDPEWSAFEPLFSRTYHQGLNHLARYLKP